MEPCLFRHGKAPGSHAGPERDALLQWSHVFSDMVSLFSPAVKLP